MIPEECRSKIDSIMEEMMGIIKEMDQSMRAFHEAFEQDRQAYGREHHTSEEWQEWSEGWMKKGQAQGEEFEAKMKAFVESKNLGDCAQHLQMPHMMGPMGGGGGGPPPMRPEERYGSAPPPEGARFDEPEEVRAIREECESKVRAIWDFQNPPDRESQSEGGYPGTGAMRGPSPQQQEQIHEIMRECEKRMRLHFEGQYKAEFAKDEGEHKGMNEHFGSFSMYFDASANEIKVTGKFLALSGNPDSQQMTDIKCGGQTFIDVLEVNGYLEDFDFEDTGEGTALRVKAGDTRILQIHDNPRCTINIATGGTIAEVTLDLADYLDVSETDNGIKFSDGDVDGRVLVHDGDFELGDGNELVFDGKATFLVSNSVAAQASSSSLANDLNVKAALEEGNIGAEIVVASDEGEEKSDATSYGDLEVSVDSTGDNTVSVTVDSASEDGKTLVMSLDDEVLSVENLDDVDVTVFDVAGEAEGDVSASAAETEACTREADNLQDILDPNDDGDCNEYWVVIDKNGAQVLVSNPHYSEKRIQISSTGGGSNTPGADLAVLTLAIATGLVLIAVGARRDD